MNSLVKVPPYSKLNFQGENFFTHNWCNITLSLYLKVIWGLCTCNYSYVYTQNTFLLASDIFFINCAWQIIYPERVQILGHVHIICITVRENRIICCQIFCDLLLKSANERIFNVMQLILVKNKWHIKKWFTRHETDRFRNNHCQECVRAYLSIHDCLSFRHEVMIGNHRNKTTES
jgi:hypothetical protein